MSTPAFLSGPAVKRILCALDDHGPLPIAQIAVFAHVSATTLSGGGYIKTMKLHGLIYIHSWLQSDCGFATPVYYKGALDDAVKPRKNKKNMDNKGLESIVRALEEHGQMTYREIAEKTGLAHTTIKNAKYMEVLVVQKRVHVSAWRRSKNGPMTQLYEAGPGTNAKRPTPYSQAEKSVRHRFRKWQSSMVKDQPLWAPARPVPISMAVGAR